MSSCASPSWLEVPITALCHDDDEGAAATCNVSVIISQAIDRRERLRRLALETIDLAKDPYFMRNHLGQYECRLCLTLHNNEGNYLAHTQVHRSSWKATSLRRFSE